MIKSNTFSKFLIVFLGLILTFGLFGCSEDKKKAKDVDELIELLPENVTLADETEIVAARGAYNLLTENQKTLVTKLEILEEKEAALADLKDRAAALAVDNKINALPTTVALTDKTAIEAARSDYNALTAKQKTYVTKLSVLEAKEAALTTLQNDTAKAQAVIDKITALPATITLENETAVISARTSYTALTAAQKAMVTNLVKLQEAETEIASLKQIKGVEDLINDLPEISAIVLADEADIQFVRTTYDNLSEANRARVSNYTMLQSAEAKILELKQNEEDKVIAQNFDNQVLALPNQVTLQDKATVTTLRETYNALTENQKFYTTALFILEACEARIADLETAEVVINKISLISEVVTLTDEAIINEARTAYDALTTVQKGFVSNYNVLVQKEEALAIVKNPDLQVLLPVIAQVPSQVITDFNLPKPQGVVWAFKNSADNIYYDLETGELLLTTYGVKNITLVVTYNQTSKDVVVNFGLLNEGQTAIFYTGATKPADGITSDGYGTYDTQLATAGFGGYMITVGTKVYFISKASFIPISGTTENELISRSTLRPLGLATQTDVNNIGLKNGVPVGYSGAGALYFNNGSVAVTFDASDTYGRLNVPNLGYGKITFTPNTNGTYTVKKHLPDHSISGSGDTLGSTNKYIATLLPGEYLWTPHTWDVDYTNIGYGTRLNQLHNGVLAENTIIKVTPYKIQDPDKLAVRAAVAAAPKQIYNDMILPTENGVVWTYKNAEDKGIYDIETGELMRLSVENKNVTFVVTKGNYSQEVVITFGLMLEGKTQYFYNADANNAAQTGGTVATQTAKAGFGGYTFIVGNKQYFIGKNAYIPISATEENAVIPQATLRPIGLTNDVNYNIGLINGVASNQVRGYGALYYNSGTVNVKFDPSFTYGRNNAGYAGYGKIILTLQEDGTYLVNTKLADSGTNTTTTTTEATMVTLKPGEYLWCPHTWEVSGTYLNQTSANGVLTINSKIQIIAYKNTFAVTEVESKINALPAEPALTNETAVVAARTAYNSLTDKQKTYVTNLAKLEAAEARIADLKVAKTVDDQIMALPAEITLDNETSVVDARNAYNTLSETQKALVTKLTKLSEAEAKIVDLKAAKTISDLIAALPETITLDNENAVILAKNNYDALTAAQKVYVTNVAVLDAAVATINSLKAVYNVTYLINGLPTEVILSDEEQIVNVRNAFNDLTASEQAQITNVQKLIDAEAALAALKTDAEEKAAALAVQNMIAALPETITLENEADVVAARTAYDLLNEVQKALVTNYALLQAAEAAISDLQITSVEVMITALPETITLADEAAVVAARTAYDLLSTDEKTLVENYASLQAAEDTIVSLKKVVAVIDLITALPETITLDNEEEVNEAKTAYDLLSAAEQATVTNYAVLTAAIAKIASIKAVNNVIALIAALPETITLTEESLVSEANNAYLALSVEEKSLVSNYLILEAAINTINNLKAALVQTQIASLPETVIYESATVIKAARSAYDALTEAQKALVENYAILTTSEATLTTIVTTMMQTVIAETPTQILVNYPLATLSGAFAWSYKEGQDATCFDIAQNKLLKVSMPITNRILVIKSVEYPSVSQEVTINFGITPVGTTAAINGNPTTPTNGVYTISSYYVNPYNSYTLSFTKSSVKYQYFTVYSLDILSTTTNFKPTSKTAGSIGFFYANKSGEAKTIPLTSTYADGQSNANQKLVMDSTGKVTQIITTFTSESVTIPVGGYFFVPYYLDGPVASNANSTNYNMKAGWAVNDVISIKKGQLNHMYPSLNGAVIDDTYQLPKLNWTSSHPNIISSNGTITLPEVDTQVTLTTNVIDSTESVTVTVKAKQTIAQVNALCDANTGVSALFEGVVIAITADNYYFIADATSTLYIRKNPTGLVIGDKVQIIGVPTLYISSNNQYTRQVSDIIKITKIASNQSNPLSPIITNIENLQKFHAGTTSLTTEEIGMITNNALFGKYISVAGYITVSGNNVYLATSTDVDAQKVFIYNQSQYYNELKFMVGTHVEISGVFYNYSVAEGWALMYYGEISEISDEEKEALAAVDIQTVITEGLNVYSDINFFTKTNAFPYLLKDITYSFSSSDTSIIGNNGIFTAPTVTTPINISVLVTFSETHTKTYNYTINALALAEIPAVLYSTGFESTDGFAASTVYNNQTPKTIGSGAKTWSVYFGTPTTTDKITGSQSIQMRWYTSTPAMHGYLVSNFKTNNLGTVVFNAKSTESNNLNVYYSFDGVNWLGEQLITLTTTSAPYTYTVNQSNSVYIKFVLVPLSGGTATSRVTIDDVVFNKIS